MFVPTIHIIIITAQAVPWRFVCGARILVLFFKEGFIDKVPEFPALLLLTEVDPYNTKTFFNVLPESCHHISAVLKFCCFYEIINLQVKSLVILCLST